MPSSKRAIIRNGRIIYNEEASVVTPNDMQARANRENMKVQHRKAMLQPSETAYYKAYPEQLKDLPDETRRLLS